MKYVNTLLNIFVIGLFIACSNTTEPQGGSTPVSGSDATQSRTTIQLASSDSMVPVPNQGAPLNSPPRNPLSIQATSTQVSTTPQSTQITNSIRNESPSWTTEPPL